MCRMIGHNCGVTLYGTLPIAEKGIGYSKCIHGIYSAIITVTYKYTLTYRYLTIII